MQILGSWTQFLKISNYLKTCSPDSLEPRVPPSTLTPLRGGWKSTAAAAQGSVSTEADGKRPYSFCSWVAGKYSWQMSICSWQPQLGWLKQQKLIFLQPWSLGNSGSRCWQVWFLGWKLSMTCRWWPSCCVLTGPFLSACWEMGAERVQILWCHKDSSPLELRPHPHDFI